MWRASPHVGPDRPPLLSGPGGPHVPEVQPALLRPAQPRPAAPQPTAPQSLRTLGGGGVGLPLGAGGGRSLWRSPAPDTPPPAPPAHVTPPPLPRLRGRTPARSWRRASSPRARSVLSSTPRPARSRPARLLGSLRGGRRGHEDAGTRSPGCPRLQRGGRRRAAAGAPGAEPLRARAAPQRPAEGPGGCRPRPSHLGLGRAEEELGEGYSARPSPAAAPQAPAARALHAALRPASPTPSPHFRSPSYFPAALAPNLAPPLSPAPRTSNPALHPLSWIPAPLFMISEPLPLIPARLPLARSTQLGPWSGCPLLQDSRGAGEDPPGCDFVT